MGIGKPGTPADDKQAGIFGRAATRCRAFLLTRIYEYLPLLCPRCGEPMRIIAFVLDPLVIERIFRHIVEPTDPPAILSAWFPPQGEIEFDQPAGQPEWPDMDQATDPAGDTWD